MKLTGYLLILLLAGCSSQVQKSKPLPRKSPPKAKTTPVQAKNEPSPEEEASTQRYELLYKAISTPNVVLLDVRTAEEFVNGHLKGAKNIDFLKTDFEAQVKKLSSKKRYLLYCDSGNRSGKAVRYFVANKLKAESIDPYGELKSLGLAVEGIHP